MGVSFIVSFDGHVVVSKGTNLFQERAEVLVCCLVLALEPCLWNRGCCPKGRTLNAAQTPNVDLQGAPDNGSVGAGGKPLTGRKTGTDTGGACVLQHASQHCDMYLAAVYNSRLLCSLPHSPAASQPHAKSACQ
jgi:hypothetical protein